MEHSPHRQHWYHIQTDRLLASTFFLLVFAFAYSPATTLSFSLPDDHWMLLKNEYVHPDKMDAVYFETIFNRISNIQYSPLNTLYYHLVFQINGFDPFYFHLMNIIIHFFNALLVFCLVTKLLRAFSLPNSLVIAYITTLFWVIHPMHVEAVAWISGSKILLCTFFTLASFNQFIAAVVNKKWYCFLLSFLFFVISFYFKEQAIITPVMFLIFICFYKLYHLKKIRLSIGETLFLLFSFGATIYFGLYTIYVNYNGDLDFPPINYYPITQRLLLIAYCFYFYIKNLFLPNGLNYHREFPFTAYERTPPEFLGYLICSIIISMVIIYMIWRSEKRLFYLLCLLIGLAQLSLELQVIPMTRPAIVADRYMYFPAIVFIAAIVTSLVGLRKHAVAKLLYKPAIIAYLIYFTLYSNQMANYWHFLNLINS